MFKMKQKINYFFLKNCDFMQDLVDDVLDKNKVKL